MLVGRERELALLVGAADGPPALVVLEGEAGIGKSRLVQALLCDRAVAGRRVLVGHCHRIREPFPLGPVIEAVRGVAGDPPAAVLGPVAGALSALLPELDGWLPAAPAALSDFRGERHRIFRAVLELLGALGPTVLVLEDLHWADGATVDLLEFLAGQLPADLSLILTYRREQLEGSSSLLGLGSRAASATLTEIITLSALRGDEVGAMVAAMLEREQVSDELVEVVYERTAGNPFAVEQVMRLLGDRGALVVRHGRWTAAGLGRLAVPPALRDSVLQRVGLLAGDARAVIEAAAVLELPAGEELIRDVAGLPAARARRALCDALSTAVLQEAPVEAEEAETEAGLYRFCHALAAQAIHDAIPLPRRRRLHLRAARALEAAEAPRPLARLAHHYKQGGGVRQWLRYAECAADACAAVGEDRDAAVLLIEALSNRNASRAAKARMALKLGDVALFGRVPRPAIEILRGALEDAALPRGVRGELRFSLARLLLEIGDRRGAATEMTQAVDELRRRAELRARAIAKLVAWCGPEDRSDPDSWFHRAGRAAARQNDPVLTTEILGSRAVALLNVGDPAGWQAVNDVPWQARSAEHKLELVRTSRHLARAACSLGYYRRAGSLLDAAEGIRRELGHERFGIGLATVRAQLDWSTGRWSGLEARAQTLVEATPDDPMICSASELIVARLLLSRGALKQAEQGFTSLVEAFRDIRSPWPLAPAASGLAAIDLARGEPQAARESLAVALSAIPVNGAWMAYGILPVAVDAVLACGRFDEGRQLVSRFASGMRGRDAPAAMATLAHCRGALAEATGHHLSAARHFSRAERAWRSLPSPYEAARAAERRGRCLLTGGRRDGADCLLGALAELERLPASWDAARVRAALRAHEVALPYPWRGGPPGYGSELSPRETEVARLVTAGLTNRQIAATLFLSPRTVDSHVASAMRKLQVSSRTELGRGREA